MNEELIKNELQKYGVTDAAIAKLNADYMALTVKTPQDMAGYEVVKKARIDIKKRRVEVEKTRVQLKAESLEYGRRVDGEAKRITALLEPIETHLTAQEKIVDDEKARIKAEAEAKEAARIQARVDRIFAFGASFTGQNYIAYGLQIPAALVKACADEQFEQFVAQVQGEKDKEDARLKAEEDARKAEAERLAKVAAEQEAERQRLAAEAKKQAEETERVKAEQEAAARKIREDQEAIERAKQKLIDDEAARLKAIEDEKKRVESEKKRAEELEKAKKEAAEKALRDAEAKRLKDEADRIEKERKAKEAAEKKAARQPDKVKLVSLISQIENIAYPIMKTDEAAKVLEDFRSDLSDALHDLRGKAEAL